MMHNYEFGSWGASRQGPYGEPEGDGPRKHSTLSLIVMIAVVAILAIVGVSVVFWALGFLFHLAGWILRVAVLAAVAAFVWRRITRHRSPDRV
jgi:putative flippase GtrA